MGERQLHHKRYAVRGHARHEIRERRILLHHGSRHSIAFRPHAVNHHVEPHRNEIRVDTLMDAPEETKLIVRIGPFGDSALPTESLLRIIENCLPVFRGYRMASGTAVPPYRRTETAPSRVCGIGHLLRHRRWRIHVVMSG